MLLLKYLFFSVFNVVTFRNCLLGNREENKNAYNSSQRDKIITSQGTGKHLNSRDPNRKINSTSSENNGSTKTNFYGNGHERENVYQLCSF